MGRDVELEILVPLERLHMRLRLIHMERATRVLRLLPKASSRLDKIDKVIYNSPESEALERKQQTSRAPERLSAVRSLCLAARVSPADIP